MEGYIRVLFRLDEVAEAERAQVLPGTAAAPKQCLIRITPTPDHRTAVSVRC